MAERDSTIVWVAAGLAVAYLLTKSTSAQGCTAGDTQTQVCQDGTTITTHNCISNQWVTTGNTCPGLGCSALIGGYTTN